MRLKDLGEDIAHVREDHANYAAQLPMDQAWQFTMHLILSGPQAFSICAMVGIHVSVAVLADLEGSMCTLGAARYARIWSVRGQLKPLAALSNVPLPSTIGFHCHLASPSGKFYTQDVRL